VSPTASPPKATSFAYGSAYQREQVEKHRARASNHWKPRIALAHHLIDKYVLPRLGTRAPGTIQVLDVGCSIGTMAIEMALRGFTARGVDFDASALELARQLAAEEGVTVEFFQADVAEWRPPIGGIDIALCFDIFEHLHDDELGALLQSLRRMLSDRGSLVFYTFPLQYDYLFFSRDVLHWPLLPLRWLSKAAFERVVRAYAAGCDVALLLSTGKTYKERIKSHSHCNPTTRSRLEDVLKRAGYSIACIETANLYPFKPHVARRFAGQPIADRHLYGVAYPPSPPSGSDSR
jgi:2-polyprenyl-3-methyl-5-hydroxy-6-metoxy-1,4-benzoquinol methylase